MPGGYHHLTYEQRCQIAVLKGQTTQIEIARIIGVHRSSISREVRRNGIANSYDFGLAQHKSEAKRILIKHPFKMTPDNIRLIEERLVQKWSPEQIAGYFKLNKIMDISHESIYQHIWADKANGGALYQHLRHAGKKYNKRGAKTSGRGLIPNRIDIEQRPKVVEEKSRIGDIEGDTIIGAQHVGAILSYVDRNSKYTKLALMSDKKMESVIVATEQTLAPFKSRLHTLTFDNGKEFAGHQNLAEMLGVDCYFAKPYHSWERGLNEHTNGLVRQYFPKQTRFDTLTSEMVQDVEDALNFRPRKILGYKTPHEVFFSDA